MCTTVPALWYLAPGYNGNFKELYAPGGCVPAIVKTDMRIPLPLRAVIC